MGLRELRQNASELVRRAQEGEELVVTVAGRPAAMLTPVRPTHWRRGSEISDIFRTPADSAAWRADIAALRELVDDVPRDPWDVRE